MSGRDVEQIVRDLVDVAIVHDCVNTCAVRMLRAKARTDAAEDRVLTAHLPAKMPVP